MKDAPPLYGWAIGMGAGAVAFGAAFVAVGIEGNGSVAIGAVVALIVGTIFTIAEKPAPAPRSAPPKAESAPTVPASAPAATAPAATAPAATAPAEAAPEAEGTKPQPLDAPVGEKDDLKQITGVGPVLEDKLNGLGVYHFWQIAGWSDDEIAWVDGFLNFKGRISRDDWIGQAKTLAESSPSKPPA
ncbi:MAG: NADH:ubiquinone oxidoreductase [Rhodobacteraceae bacterium]|nr:NADH:ubiquinone oxidoreductase [Paracoccaceae bacterium]